jgi:hypothetical protein
MMNEKEIVAKEKDIHSWYDRMMRHSRVRMWDDTCNLVILFWLSHMTPDRVQQFDGKVTDGNACLTISQSEVAIWSIVSTEMKCDQRVSKESRDGRESDQSVIQIFDWSAKWKCITSTPWRNKFSRFLNDTFNTWKEHEICGPQCLGEYQQTLTMKRKSSPGSVWADTMMGSREVRMPLWKHGRMKSQRSPNSVTCQTIARVEKNDYFKKVEWSWSDLRLFSEF